MKKITCILLGQSCLQKRLPVQWSCLTFSIVTYTTVCSSWYYWDALASSFRWNAMLRKHDHSLGIQECFSDVNDLVAKPWKEVTPTLRSRSLPYIHWSERNVANLLQVLPPVTVQNNGQNFYSSIRQPDVKVSSVIHAYNIPGLSTVQGYLMPKLKHIFMWPVLQKINQKCCHILSFR